jgi:hypothetical protein
MYSGFITSKRTLAAVGVHQRFDTVAYRMVQPYLADQTFPHLAQIIHFEGVNGPDGLKVKSPGQDEPSHLYDPTVGTGPIPELIDRHYHQLVATIKEGDMVRGGFEAAWLAHFVCDGLTPAHHFPLDKHIAYHGSEKTKRGGYRVRVLGESPMNTIRRGWAMLGGKGLLTTHLNFEMGVATALIGQRIKVALDAAKLATAQQLGPVAFFKLEAAEIAELNMYERFYHKGWSPEVARLVKTRLAPQTVQAIGIIWLLAYLEAGRELALDACQPAPAVEAEL